MTRLCTWLSDVKNVLVAALCQIQHKQHNSHSTHSMCIQYMRIRLVLKGKAWVKFLLSLTYIEAAAVPVAQAADSISGGGWWHVYVGQEQEGGAGYF